jgi:multiple sugar transport system substrate-binding protein
MTREFMGYRQASREGVRRISDAIAERGRDVDDLRWLLEASQILKPEGTWSIDPPYAYGCSPKVWKKFRLGDRIRLQTFIAFCKALGVEWREVIEPTNGEAQLQVQQIELTIGLPSEAAAPIYEVLKQFNDMTNAFLPTSYPRIRFNVETLLYGEARHEFQHRSGSYDIIMLDDPWIPAYLNDILWLDQEPLFESCLAKNRIHRENLFLHRFHRSLESVCIYNDHIVGLPILGNVQMLIHRCDVQERIASQTGYAPLDWRATFLNLSILGDYCSATNSTLYTRDDIGNDKVSVFWELLRAFGYEDTYHDDAIAINIRQAEEARTWLNQFTQGEALRDLRTSLQREGSNISAAVGWPDWVSVGISSQSPTLNKMKIRQFTEHPVMGTWLLALPRTAANPQFREFAMDVIFALTTNHTIQFLLAKQGNIPVLRNLERVEDLREVPFWRENHPQIQNALANSLPRPRTRYWADIENELNSKIYGGRFRDLPGKLVFLDSL